MPDSHPHGRRYRRIIIGIWIVVAASVAGFLFLGPVEPTAESIGGALRSTGAWGWVVFGAWLCLRGILLLPSTPMLLAGSVAFSGSQWLAVALAMGAVVVSAWLVYVLAERVGLGHYLEEKYPDKLDSLRDKIDSKGGVLGIALWAGNPFVPTSLVCYVAGLTHVDLGHYLAGVTLGELPLVALYLVGGAAFASRFLPI